MKIYFIIFGLLNLCALLVQFVHSPDIVGFFSFFTILANACATGILLYLGLSHKKTISIKTESFFGATTAYMVLVGFGYWMFLSNVKYPMMLPFVNIMIHAVMPIVVIIGWFLYEHQHRLNFKRATNWLIFPFVWLIYTFVRGPLAHWYPYPFFDPRGINGYSGVFEYILIFTLVLYFVSLFIIWIGNKKQN